MAKSVTPTSLAFIIKVLSSWGGILTSSSLGPASFYAGNRPRAASGSLDVPEPLKFFTGRVLALSSSAVSLLDFLAAENVAEVGIGAGASDEGTKPDYLAKKTLPLVAWTYTCLLSRMSIDLCRFGGSE